jgi:hypothetical protein
MMNPLHSVLISLATALCLATPLAVAGDTPSPLATWMRRNMGTARSTEDFPTLKKDFDFVGAKAPSAAYSKWATIAKAGSAASAKQDIAGVRAACNGCHETYKKKYRAEFSTRPFP